MGEVLVAEAALVAVPGLVDRHVGAGELTLDLTATGLHGLRAARRAAVADGRCGDDVERARLEAVGGGGERTDGADLDDVAGEVRVVRLVLVDRDLLERTAFEQLDERVAGDLLAEAGAACAQHAALAVEQHLRADGDRLVVLALLVDERRRVATVCERLVLQRALATLVAHRAVERVVDEQQLERALLAAPRELAGQVRLDHHVGGDGLRAAHDGLGRTLDLDDALAAGTDRVEQRVVAEARHDRADLLGGTDDERALGHLHRDAVDGQGDEVGRAVLLAHASTSTAPASSVVSAAAASDASSAR